VNGVAIRTDEPGILFNSTVVGRLVVDSAIDEVILDGLVIRTEPGHCFTYLLIDVHLEARVYVLYIVNIL
jgi:hypothetical protein